MGDKVAIPRSFAGNLGVQDCLPSIRRHYLELPLFAKGTGAGTTTGIMWGADSNTTGISPLRRNVTFEKLLITGFLHTTVGHTTTFLQAELFKNGVSTIATLRLRTDTTILLQWVAASTTPRIANGISTDRLSLRIPVRNLVTQLSCVVVFRERAD